MTDIERAGEWLDNFEDPCSIGSMYEQLKKLPNIITSLIARVEELTSVNYQLEQSCSKVGIELTKANDRIFELEREVLRQKANATVDADEVQEAIRVTRRSAFERATEIAENLVLSVPSNGFIKREVARAIRNEMDAEKGE